MRKNYVDVSNHVQACLSTRLVHIHMIFGPENNPRQSLKRKTFGQKTLEVAFRGGTEGIIAFGYSMDQNYTNKDQIIEKECLDHDRFFKSLNEGTSPWDPYQQL